MPKTYYKFGDKVEFLKSHIEEIKVLLAAGMQKKSILAKLCDKYGFECNINTFFSFLAKYIPDYRLHPSTSISYIPTIEKEIELYLILKDLYRYRQLKSIVGEWFDKNKIQQPVDINAMARLLFRKYDKQPEEDFSENYDGTYDQISSRLPNPPAHALQQWIEQNNFETNKNLALRRPKPVDQMAKFNLGKNTQNASV